jgi:hypothetical protein
MNGLLEPLEERRLMSVSTGVAAIALESPAGALVHGTLATVQNVGKGVPVSAEATDEFTAVLGILPANTIDHVARLHGDITWGDGKPVSAAKFVRNADGSIKVIGTHAYYEAEKFNISVNIWKSPAVTGVVTPPLAIEVGVLKTVANIRAEAEGGRSLIEVATRKFTVDLGSFDMPSIDLGFSATVDWGDGHKSDGVVIQTAHYGSGEFDVLGTHTYAKTGTFTVHIKVFTHLIGSPVLSGTAAEFVTTIKVMGNA